MENTLHIILKDPAGQAGRV